MNKKEYLQNTQKIQQIEYKISQLHTYNDVKRDDFMMIVSWQPPPYVVQLLGHITMLYVNGHTKYDKNKNNGKQCQTSSCYKDFRVWLKQFARANSNGVNFVNKLFNFDVSDQRLTQIKQFLNKNGNQLNQYRVNCISRGCLTIYLIIMARLKILEIQEKEYKNIMGVEVIKE